MDVQHDIPARLSRGALTRVASLPMSSVPIASFQPTRKRLILGAATGHRVTSARGSMPTSTEVALAAPTTAPAINAASSAPAIEHAISRPPDGAPGPLVPHPTGAEYAAEGYATRPPALDTGAAQQSMAQL